MANDTNNQTMTRDGPYGENVQVNNEEETIAAFIPHDVDEAEELYRTDPVFRDVVDCVVHDAVEGNGYEKSSLTYAGFFYRYRDETVKIEQARLGMV